MNRKIKEHINEINNELQKLKFQLQSDKSLSNDIDFGFEFLLPYSKAENITDIKLVIIGQDPTILDGTEKLKDRQKQINITLDLDNSNGNLRKYCQMICGILNIDLNKEVYATNLCKCIFKEKPAYNGVLDKHSKDWILLLQKELSVFSDTVIYIILGEPLINQLVHSGKKEMNYYWDYIGNTRSGNNFKFIESKNNYLVKRLFPIAHQPTWRKNKFYMSNPNGYFDDYLNFIAQNRQKSVLTNHWQDIKVSPDNTHFLYEGKPVFNKQFIEVLKFHAPGLAPVKDETGAYHISCNGNPLYSERYARTFGFYCNRATVIQGQSWFHIDEKGERAYPQNYAWTGNFQENLCTVRDFDGNYFHIDLWGNRVYKENYLYAGDFKDGIACVKLSKFLKLGKFCKHIDTCGKFINDKAFLDLGIFHKNFATAKDKDGWFHIDKNGNELYKQRYIAVEPFYNGFALVTQSDDNKLIINEQGKIVQKI